MKIGQENILHAYFLGIGGIGMSALARYLHGRGVTVSGYDRTPSALTQELVDEGVKIHYDDNPLKIPATIDLVIYTPAIKQDLQELQHLRTTNIPIKKRAEVLGYLTEGKFTIAVAGTHGKTSISSMIAHVLMQTGRRVTAFVGGIAKNYNSNFITSGQEDIMVVEADEFDRSFLELYPDIGVVSAMDADHLDIYHSRERMVESFELFVKQIKNKGSLVRKHGLNLVPEKGIGNIDYGTDEDSSVRATNIRIEEGRHIFDLVYKGGTSRDISLMVPGRHNIENSLAAIAVSQVLGIPSELAVSALNSFAGVQRRFDIRVETAQSVFIDDYAHHPEELRAFISAVKEVYPDRPITGIFQPHLYSRTRDFAEGFAKSLDLLNQIILLEIYPAREVPIPGVTSELIFEKIKNPNKKLIRKGDLLSTIRILRPEVLLTMGAGDIDQFVEPIEILMKELS